MYVSVKVTRYREDEMSAAEIRLPIEGAKSPVAKITVDLSSADARFIAPSGQATEDPSESNTEIGRRFKCGWSGRLPVVLSSLLFPRLAPS
jgi:hypothetical protein